MALAAAPRLRRRASSWSCAAATRPRRYRRPAPSTVEDLEIAGGLHLGRERLLLLLAAHGIEVSWTRQGGGLEIETGDGSAELFDARIDQLQGELRVPARQRRGAGPAVPDRGRRSGVLRADDLDSETKLSFGLGAGVKWLPATRLGARLQARYLPTYLDDTSSEFCDPFGFCQGWLHQFEVSGGVVIQF